MPKTMLELQLIGVIIALVVAWTAASLLDVRNAPMAVAVGAGAATIFPTLLVLLAALAFSSGQRVPFATASGVFLLRLSFALIGVMMWSRFEALRPSD